MVQYPGAGRGSGGVRRRMINAIREAEEVLARGVHDVGLIGEDAVDANIEQVA